MIEPLVTDLCKDNRDVSDFRKVIVGKYEDATNEYKVTRKPTYFFLSERNRNVGIVLCCLLRQIKIYVTKLSG